MKRVVFGIQDSLLNMYSTYLLWKQTNKGTDGGRSKPKRKCHPKRQPSLNVLQLDTVQNVGNSYVQPRLLSETHIYVIQY